MILRGRSLKHILSILGNLNQINLPNVILHIDPVDYYYMVFNDQGEIRQAKSVDDVNMPYIARARKDNINDFELFFTASVSLDRVRVTRAKVSEHQAAMVLSQYELGYLASFLHRGFIEAARTVEPSDNINPYLE